MGQINIRITNQNLEKIKEKAKIAGFKSYTGYMKHVSLNKEIKSKTDISTVIQLRKIGNNLNQITKKINTNSSDENLNNLYKDIDNILKSIEITIEKIIQY